MKALGTYSVSVILALLGIFLMTAAYSRKPLLLKLATFGTFHIDPDHPGTRARNALFIIGVVFCFVSLALIVAEKLHDLGII